MSSRSNTNRRTAMNAIAEPPITARAAVRPQVEHRFDLGIKVCLAERIAQDAVSDALVYEYLAHLYKWNGLVEHGNAAKHGATAFLQTLGLLVETLRQRGDYALPPIPISSTGLVQNGIHRLAASLATGVAPAFELDSGSDLRFDYRYFQHFDGARGRFGRTTLLKMLLRNLSLWQGQYRVALVFPAACRRDGGQYAFDQIDASGAVLWDELLHGPTFFLRFLLMNAYPGEAWLGLGQGAAGLARKLSEVADPGTALQPLRFVVYLPSDPAEVGATKQRIRRHYDIGHSSLHVSDAELDSSSLALAYCSSMSDVDLLRHFNYDAPTLPKLATLSAELPRLAQRREHCTLVGSAALELFGGRPANDLDFVGLALPTTHPLLTSHNEYAFLFDVPLDTAGDGLDGKTFVFGVPVAPPQTVLRFKAQRAERKDLHDVATLRAALAGH